MKDHQSATDVAAIHRAYVQFLSEGRVPRGVVPDFIERSWRRSAAFGVACDRIRETGRVEEADLQVVLERHGSLIDIAVPVMDDLHHLLAGSGSVILLCSDEGYILRSVGDPDFLPKAQQVALQPGVSWAEDQKGTNAICAAIIERRPVVIYAGQHYIRQNQFLACSAAPVLDPFGRVAGVLDITCDYHDHQHHTLVLVQLAVRVIERQMFRRRFERDVVFGVHRNAGCLGSPFDVQIAFASDGGFLAATPATCGQLGLEPGAFRGRFEKLFDANFDQTLDKLRNPASPTVQVRLRSDGESVFLQLAQPVMSDRSVADGTSAAMASKAPSRDADVRECLTLESLGAADPALLAAIDKAKRTLGRNIPILIEGETGTGKEWLARAIHNSGPRASGEFVALNCAAMPESMLAAQLFGSVEDAPARTASADASGGIRRASGGTLFLDEIGELPLALQARLLNLLQDRPGAPGAGRANVIDFSVICATHHCLAERVKAGTFRADLYYRINGLTLQLPPLRARNDVVELARGIEADEAEGAPQARLSTEVMDVFVHHPWPGNVRQMRTVIRTAMAMAEDGEEVEGRHLPQDFLAQMQEDAAVPISAAIAADSLANIELQAIQATIRRSHGNISAAARQLGVSRTTLYRRLKQSNLPHRE